MHGLPHGQEYRFRKDGALHGGGPGQTEMHHLSHAQPGIENFDRTSGPNPVHYSGHHALSSDPCISGYPTFDFGTDQQTQLKRPQPSANNTWCDMPENPNKNIGTGIGVGAAIGVAIGAAVAFKNGNGVKAIAWGLALGVAFGAIFDMYRRNK
jgi:hypothetical protein